MSPPPIIEAGLASLIIGLASEGGKLGLQWYFIQQTLKGKTRDQILEVIGTEYDEFVANNTAELRRFTPEEIEAAKKKEQEG